MPAARKRKGHSVGHYENVARRNNSRGLPG